MSKKPTPKELANFREMLSRLQGLLSGDIRHLHQEAFGINGEKATVDVEADAGSDSFYQEFSLELLQHDENALREIEDALRRVDEGSYGRCEGCGVWINRDRLKAVPYARNCVDCQRRVEDQR